MMESMSGTASPATAPVPPVFLRALLETVGGYIDPGARARLLRDAGARLAQLSPILSAGTLGELEARMNATLGGFGWGTLHLLLLPDPPVLRLELAEGPEVALGDDEAGAWFGAVLEGLCSQWMRGLPGADPALGFALVEAEAGRFLLEYGRRL